MRFVKKKKPIKTKICKKCGEEKLISEFYFRKENSTYRSECKKCFSETTRFFKCNKVPWRKHYYSARRRCNNNKASDYKWYGGRGIKCLITVEELKELWFRDKAYNMKRPSIDRIDSDGNYEYNNCRFIEMNDNIQERNNRFSKCIIQYDLEGIFIREWDSVKEAERKTKVKSINSCLKGKYKRAGRYIWKYKYD
jgi:hypothetical protein